MSRKIYTIKEDAEAQFDEGMNKLRHSIADLDDSPVDQEFDDGPPALGAMTGSSLSDLRSSMFKKKVKLEKDKSPRNLKTGKYGDDLELVKVVTSDERKAMARQNEIVIDDMDPSEIESSESQMAELRSLYSELSKMKKDFTKLENSLSVKNKKIEELTEELSLEKDDNLSNLLKLSRRLRENNGIIKENNNKKKLITPTPRTGNTRHPGFRRNRPALDDDGDETSAPSRTPGSTRKQMFQTPGKAASKKKRRRKKKKTERKKK